jgi:hypothetical protein
MYQDPKRQDIADRLDPANTKDSDLVGGDYWNARRNASFPRLVYSDDKAVIREWTVYSEDAWKITFIWRPFSNNLSDCKLRFNNGEEVDLNLFTPSSDDTYTFILDGTPYVKRSDIIDLKLRNGQLLIIRDVITMNTEKPRTI